MFHTSHETTRHKRRLRMFCTGIAGGLLFAIMLVITGILAARAFPDQAQSLMDEMVLTTERLTKAALTSYKTRLAAAILRDPKQSWEAKAFACNGHPNCQVRSTQSVDFFVPFFVPSPSNTCDPDCKTCIMGCNSPRFCYGTDCGPIEWTFLREVTVHKAPHSKFRWPGLWNEIMAANESSVV